MPDPVYRIPGVFAGMVAPGTIDLTRRPLVLNQDGSESSVYSWSTRDERPDSPYYGKEVLLPLADGNRILSPDEALHKYYQSGYRRHLGVFETPDQADAYAEQLHQSWGWMGGPLPTSPVSSHSPYGDPATMDALARIRDYQRAK